MAQYRERVMPMGTIVLSRMNAGEQGVIAFIDLEHDQKQRLAELGFIPGGQVRVLHIAPSGSPVAYYIKGSVVALRTCDSSRIWVNPNVSC